MPEKIVPTFISKEPRFVQILVTIFCTLWGKNESTPVIAAEAVFQPPGSKPTAAISP